jgi:hypothetical protein
MDASPTNRHCRVFPAHQHRLTQLGLSWQFDPIPFGFAVKNRSGAKISSALVTMPRRE